MKHESNILYQKGCYWVAKSPNGFHIYQDVVTHAKRVAIIGFQGEEGMIRAKHEIERRLS